ncbi:trypsin-like peptidase domain-containing protein [Pyxidicoccus sp. 3LG]
MSRYALIIGVDDYADPDWKLGAAVDDALAFREWAVGPGGVKDDAEHVQLLLKPLKERQVKVPYEPATGPAIVRAIKAFQQGRGAEGERLYVYYAGHGLAAPEVRDELVLVPGDVGTPLDEYANWLLGFSQLIPPLQEKGPREQFFFIDACRDFALKDFTRGVAPVVGRWKGPPPNDTPERRAQYLLYATSPGERAKEAAGRGVFGRVLLEGLKGAPGALEWSADERCYHLRFSSLASYVRAEVEEQVKGLGDNWRRYAQVPESDVPPGAGARSDVILSKFDSKAVRPLPLKVRVSPSLARKTCMVEVVFYGPGDVEAPAAKTPPPPVGFPVELQLSPGSYTVRARATNYAEARRPFKLDRAQSIDLELPLQSGGGVIITGGGVPLPDMGPIPRMVGGVLGEVLKEGRFKAVSESLLKPFRAPVLIPKGPVFQSLPETLTVESQDPHVFLVVFGPDEQPFSGIGRATLRSPRAGIYQARLMVPEGTVAEHTFEVRPGSPERVLLGSPKPRLGTAQQEALQALGMAPDEKGYLHPSEVLRPVADAPLASLLGFAAFSASIQATTTLSHGFKLEGFGIHPPAVTLPGGSGLLVVIGATGDQPVKDLAVSRFLGESRLILHDSHRQSGGSASFAPLSGFTAAAQWSQPVAPGSWMVELRLPTLAPTRYAVSALPGRTSILVAVVEDSGEVEVQQYLAPVPGGTLPGQGLPTPGLGTLRHVELGQRYFSAGRPLPDHHVDELLEGKFLDPLLACIAGYSLVRTGRPERYSGRSLQGAGPRDVEPSAMRNMLKFFGELPDSHILAALCEPERRDAHFARALELGLPVFTDGFRALRSYVRSLPSPAAVGTEELRSWGTEADRGLLSASAWTAWVVRRPAIPVRAEDGRFNAPPADWRDLEARRDSVERNIRSIGRVKIAGPQQRWVGTAAVVAEDLVLTTSFVAEGVCQRNPDGGYVPTSDACIDFSERLDPADAEEFDVVEVLGLDPDTMLAVLRIARRSRQGGALPGPLTLARRSGASAPARPGQRVYLVGYPASTLAGAEERKRIFEDAPEGKRLQPGEVLRVLEASHLMDYDCSTMPGNAGSAVFDLETGAVLGLHHSALTSHGVRVARAVSLWTLEDSPLLRAVRWSP